MRKLVLPCVLLPFVAMAQTTHTVQVVGSPGGAMPAYVPADITIDLGDEVEWVCNQGSHNVYAELDSFPDNPAPFNSAPTAQTSPWTYAFTFTLPGLYHYGCNGGTVQMPHWPMQQGTVLVVDPNGVAEVDGWGRVSLFPMPANEALYVRLDGAGVQRYELLSTDGRLLRSILASGQGAQAISLEGLQNGSYLLRITDRTGRTLVRSFVKY
jgi:plastocyanin